MLATTCTITVLCNPDGPGTPFGNGWLALFDVARLFCVVGGVAVIVAAPGAAGRCRTSGQRARFIAFALWAMATVDIVAQHLGDWGSIRLALDVLATGYALWGMWSFRMETPGGRGDTDRA